LRSLPQRRRACPPCLWPKSRTSAQADILPVKNDKYKWKGGGCKYEFKANHKGFKEKYKCK